jgi:glycosyltransferase involved in cell wall biosynthesis
MVEKKGFDLLLDACGMLKARNMPFVLELAGDGPLKRELAVQASMKGMKNETVFLGPMDHDKVPEWLKGLDVFALACKQDSQGDMDGIPVVLMEAMLSGVPVVSTRVSGVPELIEDGVTGWLAAQPDAVSLASAMHSAILDGGIESGILVHAEEKVRRSFDLAKNARTLAKLYQGESI